VRTRDIKASHRPSVAIHTEFMARRTAVVRQVSLVGLLLALIVDISAEENPNPVSMSTVSCQIGFI